MNYYNPYFFNTPQAFSTTARTGLFSRMFGRSGITLGGILNGTQRALSFANQAIPFVKQVKPMIGNAKTMFKVMNEFKRSEKPRSNVNSSNLRKNSNNYIENNKVTNIKNENISSNNGPTFFM